MKRGKFIVIEGGDGAGKDTQIALLQKRWGAKECLYPRATGGTPLGKETRRIVLHRIHGEVSLPAELFLFLADRAQHVAEVIAPALAKGTTVISHRSWMSFIAYQIYGRNQHDWKPLVEEAIRKIYADRSPDLVVLLNLPPDVGLERIRKTGRALDTMESMPLSAHQEIQRGFLETLATLPRTVIVDAARPKEEVWKDVEQAVLSVFSVLNTAS